MAMPRRRTTGAAPKPTNSAKPPVSGTTKVDTKQRRPSTTDTVKSVPSSNRKQGRPVGADTDRMTLGSPDTSVHGGATAQRTPKAQHGISPADGGLSVSSPAGRQSSGDSATGASNAAANTQAHARPGQGTKGAPARPSVKQARAQGK